MGGAVREDILGNNYQIYGYFVFYKSEYIYLDKSPITKMHIKKILDVD